MDQEDYQVAEYAIGSELQKGPFYHKYVSNSLPVILRNSCGHMQIFEDLKGMSQNDQDNYFAKLFQSTFPGAV